MNLETFFDMNLETPSLFFDRDSIQFCFCKKLYRTTTKSIYRIVDQLNKAAESRSYSSICFSTSANSLTQSGTVKIKNCFCADLFL